MRSILESHRRWLETGGQEGGRFSWDTPGFTLKLYHEFCRGEAAGRKRWADWDHLDLSGVDLSLADLGIMNFEGSSFRGAYLIHTEFRHTNLNGADLSGAQCEGAYFRSYEPQQRVKTDARTNLQNALVREGATTRFEGGTKAPVAEKLARPYRLLQKERNWTEEMWQAYLTHGWTVWEAARGREPHPAPDMSPF